MLYSFDVTLEGKGACRRTDKLFMNHMNAVCLGAVLLIAGGLIGSFLAGGASLAATAAGVAIVAGTGGASPGLDQGGADGA
jgi:hypothetical protein